MQSEFRKKSTEIMPLSLFFLSRPFNIFESGLLSREPLTLSLLNRLKAVRKSSERQNFNSGYSLMESKKNDAWIVSWKVYWKEKNSPKTLFYNIFSTFKFCNKLFF
jgi:hypothetical protein